MLHGVEPRRMTVSITSLDYHPSTSYHKDMTQLLDWIKAHKLASLLVIVIVWLIWPRYVTPLLESAGLSTSPGVSYRYDSVAPGYGGSLDMVAEKSGSIIVPPFDPSAPPQTDTGERMVVTDTSLAMVVPNVSESQDKIVSYAEAIGGYLVNSNLTHPEEAPYATVTVRVPSDKLEMVMGQYRDLALKITSEYVSGRDVTDEYVDLTEHIAQLEATKSRYEEIREKATEITDLISVTQQITNIQTQIDNYKGRQKYLEQTAKLSKVTVQISTDELALPYAPPAGFRPAVIFKYAVRSLMGTFANIGEGLIWLGVYSAIWLPILVILWLWRRRQKKEEAV